jgi:hypothetical protein
MPNYLSPGVYMEEVDRGTKPIEAVGTAVAAFVGYTEKAEEERNGEVRSLLGKPSLVTNWSQYVQKFGGFISGAYTPDAVYGYFANGGSICYIVSIKTLGKASEGDKATAAEVTVQTGEDRPSNILKVTAKDGGPSGNNLSVEVRGVAQLPSGDDGDDKDDKDSKSKSSKSSSSSSSSSAPAIAFNLSVKVNNRVVERYDSVTLTKGDQFVETLIAQQSQLVSVSVIGSKTDVGPAEGTFELEGGKVETKAITLNDYRGDVAARTGLGGLEPLDDITMLCVPDLMTAYENGELDMKGVQAVQQSIIDYCELVRYCFAILDCPPGMMPQEMKEWRFTVNYDTTRAAVYYPWLEIADLTGGNGRTRVVPPSGHVAGIYARTDNTRGVHKAPANEIARACIGLDVAVTKGEQDLLNPIGVNCIRSFPGRGIRVWGARTLSSDASWRYINVRRLFNMIEESIERGTQWVVFEPNDQGLWRRVERDVSAFLRVIWRTGALQGTNPTQGFYVKCDEETNPPETRDLGQLICEIGIAPVKPAEFVIFRVSQWQPE